MKQVQNNKITFTVTSWQSWCPCCVVLARQSCLSLNLISMVTAYSALGSLHVAIVTCHPAIGYPQTLATSDCKH